MKLSHTKLVIVSGLVWFVIGVYLLQLGLNLLLASIGHGDVAATGSSPIVKFLTSYVGSMESAALMLVILALFIGYFKGRYVLGKSAQRGVARILNFPNPSSLSCIYSLKYYLLLGSMVALGISIKYMGLSNDIRGVIDATIGSALINGSMIYFKLAQGVKARGEG